MHITETKNEGLKREYTITLDAASINEEMESQLRSMGERVKIPGFRPGHVPLTVLKQRYAKNVMGDVIERALSQSSQKVLRDKSLRAALPPKLEILSYQEGNDLNYRMELEVLPDIPEIDFSAITLEKMVCGADPKEVQEALSRLADRNKNYTRKESGATAENGDQVVIDFTGSVDGEKFEGGAAKKFALTLGSGQFIQGFEEQLVGAKEGDEPVLKVTFPAHYHKADLAGKPAEFAVTVHEIRSGKTPAIDEALAQKMGFADLAGMQKAVESQFTSDYEEEARARMKKALFDALEESCTFPIPQNMVDLEFKSIWEKIEEAKKEGDTTLTGKSDEALREEYEKVASRRVKLGILLSDVALKNKIQVHQDELSRAVMQQASQFPGQEKLVYDFYQKNPRHIEDLRGPILEEKAVNFIFTQTKISERIVTRAELMNDSNPEASPPEPAKAPQKKTAKK